MDRALTVPHFEKMDYVQAALLPAYLDAYRLTGNAAYAEVARDITKLVEINDEYQRAETRLAELMDEWERAEAATSARR